jgi:beta-galactosidase
MDTVIFYKSPDKPQIKFIENNGEKIRVQFDPIITATSYKLVYGETELNITTSETIDNWIETDKLSKESTIGKTYSVKLVAVNSFGETASEVSTQKILKNWVFPPVVKGFKPFMGGLSIGYASDPNEYLYKVQYSTSPDFTSNTHIIQTPTKGACFVPNLKAGVKYYFRMCTVHQYEVQSDWGMTYSVVI